MRRICAEYAPHVRRMCAELPYHSISLHFIPFHSIPFHYRKPLSPLSRILYIKPSVLFFFGSFFFGAEEWSRGVFTHRGKGRRNLVQGAGVGCIHGFTGPSDWRAFFYEKSIVRFHEQRRLQRRFLHFSVFLGIFRNLSGFCPSLPVQCLIFS